MPCQYCPEAPVAICADCNADICATHLRHADTPIEKKILCEECDNSRQGKGVMIFVFLFIIALLIVTAICAYKVFGPLLES